MTRFFLEEHSTPIYRRIARALGTQLLHLGMDVLMVKPEGFNTTSFRTFLAAQGPNAVYIANSPNNAIVNKVPGRDEYLFESFAGSLVFLHHDAILVGSGLLAGISKLQAWQRVAARAVHLCIERYNVDHLKAVGLAHAHWVPHVSEVAPREPAVDGFRFETTFVGHVVPSACAPQSPVPRVRAFFDEAIALRRSDCAAPLAGLVQRHLAHTIEGLGDAADQAVLNVAATQWLRDQLETLALRGWLFETCPIDPLVIFGGDPAYLHRIDRHLQVQRAGVSYRPAVYEPEVLQSIFHQSRVSLNLSALQFDDAVVNRFHDVVLSGGLCLTDALSGLAELTSVHADVSYRTVDELQERAAYFCHPANAEVRAELIRTMQRDIVSHSGYPVVAQRLLQALTQLTQRQ